MDFATFANVNSFFHQNQNTMNINKMLLGALAGGVAYFLLGWLVYGMLLANTFAPSEETLAVIAKEEFGMVAMLVSCLAYGLLLAYVYARWANISTFATGAKAGAIIGALTSLWINMSMFAMYNFVTIENALIDLVVHAAVSALVGGVIGLVLGSGKSG